MNFTQILSIVAQLISKVPDVVKYIQYIPLLVQLIQLIREAETLFTNTGSGEEKRAAVKAKFIEIVTSFQAAGLLNQTIADALRNGIDAVITIIVQIMKFAGGVKKVQPAEVVMLTEFPASPATASV